MTRDVSDTRVARSSCVHTYTCASYSSNPGVSCQLGSQEGDVKDIPSVPQISCLAEGAWDGDSCQRQAESLDPILCVQVPFKLGIGPAKRNCIQGSSLELETYHQLR